MKRQPPLKALKVAQMRVDAAVTITITGKAGSGKSTAAEIITKALANHGYNAKCIESDDDIYYSDTRKRGNQDDRLFLTIVEDSKLAYAAPDKEQEATEKCDGNCDECNGEKIPMGADVLLKFMAMQAASQRM